MRSTVNEKLTWIATLIRSNTGITKKLSLDDMAVGVDEVMVAGIARGREDGISTGKNIGGQEGIEEGKFIGRLEGLEEGIESVPFRVHKILLGNDLTSGTNTLLTGNQFIKDHYQDKGFMVQYINLFVKQQGTIQLGYGVCANRGTLPSGDGYIYGYCMHRGTGGAASNYSYKHTYTDDGCYGVPKVNANGDITVRCESTKNVLTAGEYLIILSVAEV